MQRAASLEKTWCWERLKARGDDSGWDGRMESPTRWTRVWVSSRSWWWTGKPGVLQSMGSQRVGHDWVTELKAFLHSFPHVIAFISDTDISSNIPAGGSTTHGEPRKQKLLKFTWSYWLLSGKQTFFKNETNIIFKIITVNKCQSLTLDKLSMFWIKQMTVCDLLWRNSGATSERDKECTSDVLLRQTGWREIVV